MGKQLRVASDVCMFQVSKKLSLKSEKLTLQAKIYFVYIYF